MRCKPRVLRVALAPPEHARPTLADQRIARRNGQAVGTLLLAAAHDAGLMHGASAMAVHWLGLHARAQTRTYERERVRARAHARCTPSRPAGRGAVQGAVRRAGWRGAGRARVQVPPACSVGVLRRRAPPACSVGVLRRRAPSACSVGALRRHSLTTPAVFLPGRGRGSLFVVVCWRRIVRLAYRLSAPGGRRAPPRPLYVATCGVAWRIMQPYGLTRGGMHRAAGSMPRRRDTPTRHARAIAGRRRHWPA